MPAFMLDIGDKTTYPTNEEDKNVNEKLQCNMLSDTEKTYAGHQKVTEVPNSTLK